MNTKTSTTEYRRPTKEQPYFDSCEAAETLLLEDFQQEPRPNEITVRVMTDRKSFGVVRAWREWGRDEVMRGYLRCLRLMRESQRERMSIEAARKSVKDSTEHKIEKAEAKLAEWEKKRDHAETYIAKYRRKLRALRAAQTRKQNAAAKGGE